MCVRLHSGNCEPKMLIFQTTPDEHPTPPPCRRPALIILLTLAKFQFVWRRLCDGVLFRFCCKTTPVRPPAHYPSTSLVVNIMCIKTFCDHQNVVHISSTRLVFFLSQAGALRHEYPPRGYSFPFSLYPPDTTAKPMASSHHFTLRRQISAR